MEENGVGFDDYAFARREENGVGFDDKASALLDCIAGGIGLEVVGELLVLDCCV